VCGLGGTGCFGAGEEHRGGRGSEFGGCASGRLWSLGKEGAMGLAASGAESPGGEQPRSEPGHPNSRGSMSWQEPFAGPPGAAAMLLCLPREREEPELLQEKLGSPVVCEHPRSPLRARNCSGAQPARRGDQQRERVLGDGSGTSRGSSQRRSRGRQARF